MAERTFTVKDGREGVAACAMLILAISLAIFLFNGEPDIHDGIRAWVLTWAQVKP